MSILYLDIDGVLNCAGYQAYNTLSPVHVKRLCTVLDACPSTQIVLSSAWRYLILGNQMTERGMEYIFCLFGAPYNTVAKRIARCTESDEDAYGRMEQSVGQDQFHTYLKESGHLLRQYQIYQDVLVHGVEQYMVVDDMDLEFPGQIITDPLVGLTDEDVVKLIAGLK